MSILYESYAKSTTVTVTAEEAVPPEVFTCPVCEEEFPTEEAMLEHLRKEHPLHYWFWFWQYDTIPAGKLLLGGSVLTAILLAYAATRPKKPPPYYPPPPPPKE